jgi:hypothetical protein
MTFINEVRLNLRIRPKWISQICFSQQYISIYTKNGTGNILFMYIYLYSNIFKKKILKNTGRVTVMVVHIEVILNLPKWF